MRETYITIYIEEIKDTYKYWKKKKIKQILLNIWAMENRDKYLQPKKHNFITKFH